MKNVNVQLINLNFKNYLLISFIFQVNGSLLSRMKNRYEYLPLPIPKDFTVEDMDYIIDEPSPSNSISSSTMSNLVASDQNNFKSTNYEPSSQKTVIRNFTELNSELMTAVHESKFQKRKITTEDALHYYDQDKWPAIKLFVALTSTRFQQTPSATVPIKQRKRTWPPYFPPKFISKLQAELDDALLPWKTTTAFLLNISTNVSANSTKDNPLTRYGSEAHCFMCGLDQANIPRMPGCYHIFENDDQRTRKLQRRMKVKCIPSSVKKKVKNKYYGPGYTGGCFKRFLDVGVEYNERGCRTKEPTMGRSFASKRLAYLERMLKDTDNGCVFSPYASLTPFSREISLYARYHVCVCDTRYCNGALHILPSNLHSLISLALYYLI